jgi:hypothetical protein
MRKSVLVRLCLFAITPSVLARPNRQSKCGAPTYKIARVDSQTNELEVIAISIRPNDVNVKNLLALACQFRSDYPSQPDVEASIFNDENAAKHADILSVTNSKGGASLAAYIAYYYLSRRKETETLTLVVDPDNPCGHDIRIDLKANTVSIVSCK